MNRPIEVLITMPFPPSLVEPLREISKNLAIAVYPAKETQDIPMELWKRVEVLYTNHVIPAPLEAPYLKWIQFHWAGIDSLVETPLLQQSLAITTTLSGAHASQMGEYILMMLLALGHKMSSLHAHQKKAEWPKDRWERFSPTELRGATVGIVGYGSIGRQAARLLQTFGTTVLAAKRDAMQTRDMGYVMEGLGDPDGDFVHRIYPFQALKSMLKECDFVVVAVPLTNNTRGLLGPEEFAAMKPGAYLVDVSRGGVIDHSALIAAIKAHKLAGAALDVFPVEPLAKESPLWEMPNVIITPHISGVTSHYDARAMALFAENLKRYLAEEPLLNQFDIERGY
jgi:phosphoglycerate dehydrogenase-like enzyme